MGIQLQDLFYVSQILVGIAFLWLILKMVTQRSSRSHFRVREADLRKDAPPSKDQTLAHAKLKKNVPLQLQGIRIDGEPHEILGVPKNATQNQIQKAYRELMKRYHPDIVARPGTDQWKEAQRIAEALNRAKDALLNPGQSA